MPTDVLLLGTPHLANPGLDMVNVEMDDVLSDRRQQELAAIGADLARYSPTKVLVEHEPDQATAVAELFAEYVAGSRELGRSEVEQIGFRVATLCGLNGVIGIDVQGPFWESRIDELAETDPEVARRLAELQAYGEAEIAAEQPLLAAATLSTVLREMNTEAALAADLRPYLALIAPIDPEGYAGADVVANWYSRNLKIFVNLLYESGPDERLLVVFGSGHTPVLRHFIEASGQFVISEVADYLTSP